MISVDFFVLLLAMPLFVLDCFIKFFYFCDIYSFEICWILCSTLFQVYFQKLANRISAEYEVFLCALFSLVKNLICFLFVFGFPFIVCCGAMHFLMCNCKKKI
jgi:hypothetical protein